MIDDIDLDSNSSSFWIDQENWASPFSSPATDGISSEMKKYFFKKIEKKGFCEAASIFDQYLQIGFSEKAAIALTDRTFYSEPHKPGHGNYLKNLIGKELFKKEQAVRKGKGQEWVITFLHKPLDEKIKSTAIQTLEELIISSKRASDISKTRNYQKGGDFGEYLLGLIEIAAGSALIVTGGVLEIATLGTFTLGMGLATGTGLSLIGLGLATTTANAKDVSIPKLPKFDPLLDIVNRPKENPRNWDEPGSPPIRGDHIVGDGTTSPYPGFDEWKGKGDPSSGKGAWYNPETKQSLHPDLHHPPPGKAHWDYLCPEWEKGAKLFPDGTWEPK